MDKATFQHPQIADYLNDKFYAVKFNAEDQSTINFKGADHNFKKAGRRGYNELAYKFANGRMSYPTIAFLDENLDRIDSYPGFKQPNQFDALLNFIEKDHYKNSSLAEFQRGFKSDIAAAKPNNVVKPRTNSNARANLKPGAKKTIRLDKNAMQPKNN